MLTSPLTDAITACQKALETGANLGATCQTLGNVLQGMGRFEEAVIWHTRAIGQPDPVEIYASLGGLYARQEQWQTAIDTYEQALRLNPNYAEAHRSLASIYARLGKRQEEVTYRYRAVTLNPGWATPSNQLVLGNSLLEANQLEAAIDCYQRALQLRPDFYEAHHNLGTALVQKQNWQDATVAFQRAIELNPNHAASHYGLGKIAEQQDQPEVALTHYQQAIALEPQSLNTYYSLGEILLKLERWQETTQVYRQAIALKPDFSWAYHNLGYALLKQKQWQAAAEALRQAVDLNPDFSWTYYFLGEALIHLGQVAEAETVLRRSIELNPESSWAYHNLIDVLIQQRQWEPAKVAAETVIASGIASGQAFPWAYTQLGRVLAEQKETAKAIECHQKACELRGWSVCRTRSYQFSQDWFSHNIPNWKQILQPYANTPGVQALEVGSFQGMSSCWLLDNILTHPSSRLTCIDPHFQPEFAPNIAKTGVPHKVIPITGCSHEVLITLEQEAYDVIYLDGCHWADYVRQEAALAWRVLRTGGLMIFDDYPWSDPNYPGQDCKFGIDAFLASVEGQIERVHQGYQVVIKKLVSV